MTLIDCIHYRFNDIILYVCILPIKTNALNWVEPVIQPLFFSDNISERDVREVGSSISVPGKPSLKSYMCLITTFEFAHYIKWITVTPAHYPGIITSVLIIVATSFVPQKNGHFKQIHFVFKSRVPISLPLAATEKNVIKNVNIFPTTLRRLAAKRRRIRTSDWNEEFISKTSPKF